MKSPKTTLVIAVLSAALLPSCSSSSSSMPSAAVPSAGGGPSSCGSGGGGGNGSTGSTGQSPLALTSTVYYDPQIKEMMTTYCANCHAGSNAPDLTSFEAVSAAAQQSLTAMQNGSMPEGRTLAAGEVSTFQQWINGGMPNLMPLASSTGTATGASTGATVTYYADVQPILAQSCTSCHGANGTSPDLSSYDAAKENLGAALTAIDAFSMPPAKSPALPSGAVTTLQAWQSGNYAEGTQSSKSTGSSQSSSSGCN